MSKIDIYSKFISKQTKIAENSSISRSIKEAEEDKGKDTSDAKKKLDDMKIKDLEDKAKKAGIDFDNPDMKSAADANSGNVTASARIGGSATGGEGKIFDRKINGKDVPLSSASDVNKTIKSTDTQPSASTTTSMDDYYAAHKTDADRKNVDQNRLKSLDAKVNQPQSGRSTESLSGDNNPTPLSVSSSQPSAGIKGTPSGQDAKDRPDTNAVTSIDPSKDPANKKYEDQAKEINKQADSQEKQKSSTSSISKPKKKQETRFERMSKSMHAGDLQGVVSGTYGESVKELRTQIIEKYSCGDKMYDKMKKKKTDK